MVKNTPAMGWNSWNTFAEAINEKTVIETADFMAANGYLEAGYEYIVIDDCWSLRERVNGKIVADPEKFPHGMKYVADYVHSKGFKFGMYSCAAARTCADYPGSYNHEFEDAKMFADFGVDLLKYDYCFHSVMEQPDVLYKRMGIALANCGRDILYSACSWGADQTNYWVKETGANMFRSTGDIADYWESIRNIAVSQLKLMELNGVGCFNDLDMLVVGMHGEGHVSRPTRPVCTVEEYFTHFAFWCLYGSPLMIGADVRKMSDANKEILFNKDLIRIDQDKKGCMPFIINKKRELNEERTEENPYYFKSYETNFPVLARYLDDGKIAIGAFNFSDSNQRTCFYLNNLGIPASAHKKLKLKNVQTGEITESIDNFVWVKAAPHNSIVYIAEVVDE